MSAVPKAEERTELAPRVPQRQTVDLSPDLTNVGPNRATLMQQTAGNQAVARMLEAEATALAAMVPVTAAAESGTDAKAAVDRILDALRGYTSDADSANVWREFEGKSPATVRAIMAELRSRASQEGEPEAGMVAWLLADLAVPQRQDLRVALARAQDAETVGPDGVKTTKAPDAEVVREAADAILADLKGVTGGGASHRIVAAFNEKSPATIDAIIERLGVLTGESRDAVVTWLLEDLTAEDRRDLRNLFSRVSSSDGFARLVAEEVKDRLAGFTSEDDSREIVATLTQVSDSGLDRVLGELEKLTGWSENRAADELFGDLDAAAAVELRNYFFGTTGKACIYAIRASATAIMGLLTGYTSHADARSIVGRFMSTPDSYRVLVLAELQELTKAEWSKTAEEALSEYLPQASYDELKGPLRLSDRKNPAGSLQSAGESTFEVIADILEIAAGAVVGVVHGLAEFAWGIVRIVIDIPVALHYLKMSAAYGLTGGLIGHEEWLETKEFFGGLAQVCGHPIDTFTKVWAETVKQSEAIEGPFEYGRRTEFWVSRVTTFIANLVFVFVGAPKAARSALGLINEARTIGLKAAFVKRASDAAVSGARAVAKLGETAEALLKLLRQPLASLTAIRERLNVLLIASERPNVWRFLRTRAGALVDDELTEWKKLRDAWRGRATGTQKAALQLADKADGLGAQLAGDKVSPSAADEIAQLEKQANALESDVAAQEAEVLGAKQADGAAAKPSTDSPTPVDPVKAEPVKPAPVDTEKPPVVDPAAERRARGEKQYDELVAKGEYQHGTLTREEFAAKYEAGKVYDPKVHRWHKDGSAPAKKLVFTKEDGWTEDKIFKRLTTVPQHDEGPTSTFKAFYEMLVKQGIDTPEGIKARLKSLNPVGKGADKIRGKLKDFYRPLVRDRIAKPEVAAMVKKYPELPWNGPDGGKTAYNQARYREMTEFLGKLAPSDKGNMFEEWYQAVHSPDSLRHVELTPETLKKAGVNFAANPEMKRFADLFEADGVCELKAKEGPLSTDEKKQFQAYMRLVNKQIPIEGKTVTVKAVKYVFAFPEGTRANADWIAEQLTLAGGFEVEIFNSKGAKDVLKAANATKFRTPEFWDWLGVKRPKGLE